MSTLSLTSICSSVTFHLTKIIINIFIGVWFALHSHDNFCKSNDRYHFMSLITHRVRINIYGTKIYKKDTFDYKHWEWDRCHIFSLDFYHCLLDEKLWGVDWYNSAIFDASSYKQPVKFKDRNMRDKCFHLNNQFLMLIFKFYSLCLFNEFLKKKFIIYIHQYTDPGVFSCIIWKKKMNLTCLKIKERNSDWNFVKKENERKRENSLQALEIRCYVVFPTCF